MNEFAFYGDERVQVNAWGGRVRLMAALIPGALRMEWAKLLVMDGPAHPDAEEWPDAVERPGVRATLPYLPMTDTGREMVYLTEWLHRSWAGWARELGVPDEGPRFIALQAGVPFAVYRGGVRQDDGHIGVCWTAERGVSRWEGRGPVRVNVDRPEPLKPLENWVQVQRDWVHTSAQLVNIGRGAVRGLWFTEFEHLM